jgi:hypothetical protein
MHEFLVSVFYFGLILSPCIVACRCASERRMLGGKKNKAYIGMERRDPR